MKRRVYFFGNGNADGTADMKDILGGKGAGLAEMSKAGIPVPPGFTIATSVCMDYYKNGRKTPKGLDAEQKWFLTKLEAAASAKLGDPSKPLLISVRSGAKVSMPGMMDTILNLGLNDQTVEGLARLTNNPRFAYDCYRRFIMMFSDVVFDVPKVELEQLLHKRKEERGIHNDPELSATDLKGLSAQFKAHFKCRAGRDFPQDTWEQLCLARDAVFRSWHNPRANSYRKMNSIPDDMGTAVNVQLMVFGNSGDKSGTGVGFTRDPSTGENKVYGEFLINAQGEDVVAGVRIPLPIAELKNILPDVYDQVRTITKRLEKHYRDVQDFEFAFEEGRVFLLGTRCGKRTCIAAVRTAVEMLQEGLISEKEAVLRVDPSSIAQVVAPRIETRRGILPFAKGINASPGATSGVVVFSSAQAEKLGREGRSTILVLPEVFPDDITGITAARGVITLTGGMTSHASVVCRQLHKPCIVSASIECSATAGHASPRAVIESETITIDGSTGHIYRGELPVVAPTLKMNRHMRLYATLLKTLDPDEYVRGGLGTLWRLRDTFRDGRTWHERPLDGGLIPDSCDSSPVVTGYKAFRQPSEDEIRSILHGIHRCEDHDNANLMWGLVDNLLRQLQEEVGIGNHHLIFRPLNDPLCPYIDPVSKQVLPASSKGEFQLVGMEFFSINGYLRNYLPWASIQVWLVVRSPDIPWRLERVNPQGESLVPGWRTLSGFLVLLNARRLTVSRTREFYNEMRNREHSWEWYDENHTSWHEIRAAAHSILDRKPVKPMMLGRLRALGLVSRRTTLSSTGLSLVLPDSASNRKMNPLL